MLLSHPGLRNKPSVFPGGEATEEEQSGTDLGFLHPTLAYQLKKN